MLDISDSNFKKHPLIMGFFQAFNCFSWFMKLWYNLYLIHRKDNYQLRICFFKKELVYIQSEKLMIKVWILFLCSMCVRLVKITLKDHMDMLRSVNVLVCALLDYFDCSSKEGFPFSSLFLLCWFFHSAWCSHVIFRFIIIN